MSTLPPFEQVLDDHAATVLRVCVAHAGPQLADEVFQETMLAALRAYPDVREAGAIRGWLCTIAMRKALDAHRASTRRPLPVDPAVLPEPPARDAEPPGDPWPHVRALPPKQRAAVTLRFLGDLTHAEIGAVLGISADAARRNVFEGLRALRAAAPATPDLEPAR